MISPDTLLVQDSEPIPATVDDEVVMLSVRAGAYFSLNGVGSEIWNLLREPRSVGDVHQSLASLYDVDDQTLRRDVDSFLQAMLERGLLRIVEPGASER